MQRNVTRYLMGTVAAGAAFGAVWLLHPILDGPSYMVFVAAVAVVAALFGLGPALLTTALSVVLADFYFLAPRGSLALLAATDVVLLVVMGGLALLVTAGSEVLRRRLRRAESERLRALGLASLFARDADVLEREVDALHTLRDGRR